MSRSENKSTDRTHPPAAGPQGEFQFPEFQVHALDNGLEVFLSPYPRGPLVHQLLVLPGGGQQDPIGREGLTTLTASLMDEGTDLRPALEIADQVESLGGYLSTEADWDAMSASLGVLAKHADQGLELVAEIVTRASYPPRELDRLRNLHLAELQRRKAHPANLASEALNRILFDRTIYETPLLGTAETLTSIRRPEVLETAQREISPAGAALILVGEIDPESVLNLIERTFGSWKGLPRSAPRDIHPLALDGIRVALVDRPQAPQTELWLGSVGVPRSHPDRPGLVVLNSLLGGKFTSRLNLNLRERLGITYGVSSSFAQRRGPGPFVVAASVETEAVETAAQEILAEIRRLQDEPVSTEELADTQSYLSGIFPYTLQRIEGLASRLADLKVYDLPHDYFSDYLRQIAEVTRADLQTLAQRHLHPDKMALVAVGPRDQLEPRLAPFGELEIHPVQGPPEAP